MISIKTILVGLGQNFALLLSLTLIYTTLKPYLKKVSFFNEAIFTGALFAIIAIIAMLTPIEVAPGVIVDGRIVIVAFAGAFGGAISAITAGFLTAICRLWIGGSGAVAGIGAILTSTLMGVFFYKCYGPPMRYYQYGHLLIFGIALAFQGLIWGLVLPADLRWQALKMYALPVALLYPLGTFLLGTLLSIENRRAIAQDAVRDSEERYRLVTEITSDFAYAYKVEPTGDLVNVWATGAILSITGFSLDEIKARGGWKSLIYPDDMSIPLSQLQALLKGSAKAVEYRILTKTGEIRWLRDFGRPKYDKDQERITYIYGGIQDITERMDSEERLKASLKEKEILLKEIHHRVKNNLQVIISLIRLQCENIDHEQYVEMFEDTLNRIQSMALVHQKLYQTKDFTKIYFNEYAKSLVKDLFMSFAVDSNRISLKLEKNDTLLSLDSAISCGLIINELVTNSIKYAFPEGINGRISMGLREIDDEEVEIRVADNGIGMPDSLDLRNSETLGFQIVIALAEFQLGGKINIDTTKGTEFRIRFKEPSNQRK